MLLFTIFLAASLRDASGLMVMSGLDITSEILVSKGVFFATTLLTKSLSVTMPLGISPFKTTTSPTSFWVMSSAASKMVFSASMVRTPLVIKSFTFGITFKKVDSFYGIKGLPHFSFSFNPDLAT